MAKPISDIEQIVNEALERHRAGAFPDAMRLYREVLREQPLRAEVNHNLGKLFIQAGQPQEALPCLRAAMEANPAEGRYWLSYVEGLLVVGKTHDALIFAEEGRRRGLRGAEADALLQRATSSLKPGPGQADVTQLSPSSAEAHYNQGNMLQALGRTAEAAASYARAIELKPDLHEAHTDLGNALKILGRLAQAETSYRRAIELKPDFHIAHNNLGNALKDLGRLAEAQASYRRALELKPDFHEAHSNLIFALDLLEGCGAAEQQAERALWYSRHARKFAESIAPHGNLPDPGRRLRIGYVSADFRRHAANYAFGPVIHLHDRAAFEVVCYSGVAIEDETTARLRQAAEGWRSTPGVSDEDLAAQIRSDRIDILVDLSSHMAGSRLMVFARKPAPVQVTAWGYPNGTGLETIDYIFSDAVVIPREERGLFAEEVVDLPCFLCYEPPEYLPEVSPLPALAGRPFTFGCINRIEKISDGVLRLWGRILAGLPQARLLVKGQALEDPEHRRRFAGRLRDAGIGAERLRLVGRTSHAELLQIFDEVDLGLDPFPHGGAISTAEALWMGVPVVTLQGATFMSRISASILTALQMQEWIARSGEEYVRIAVEAARDLGRLAHLRGQLRPMLSASMFGDVRRYTREVEAAYRSMWRRYSSQANRA